MAFLISTNVAGSLNVTANIANTGNLLVTQNTFTGNLAVTALINAVTLNVSTNANVAALNVGGLANTITLNVSSNANVSYLNVSNLINTSVLNVSTNANVAALNVAGLANAGTLNVAGTSNLASINCLGTLAANASPLINLATRGMTGLANNTIANIVTTNLPVTNVFTTSFNEAGMYSIEGMIFYGFNSTIVTPNTSNVGMNATFNGSATIASVKYAITGRANGTTLVSNLITTKAQTALIPNTQGYANSTNNTDYLVLTGYLNVSAAGLVNIQFNGINTANANLNVCTNSYVVYTKIG